MENTLLISLSHQLASYRSMDVIARFGGEEFLIVLPETNVEAASAAMVRVQRELTKHFFLHENEKMLITFSCGVALGFLCRRVGSSRSDLFPSRMAICAPGAVGRGARRVR